MRSAVAMILVLFLSVQVATASRSPLLTEAAIPGATLRIEVRPLVDGNKAAEIVEWLRSVSSSVSLVYGRFPNPSPRVIVIPAVGLGWGGNKAVTFGRVTRNGEETVELYVNADRPIEEFYADWTATHEFSHLMLPLVGDRHKWISEGFASYYQNVLMSRAGRYSPLKAWTKLYEGFERGQASRPGLSPNEAAASGVRRARMKIYWSGAAIALLADVELRERSGGEESLDIALDRLQRCCLPSNRQWSGPELFAKLDRLVDEPVFMPLYRRYADKAGFPEVQTALQRLGVEAAGNKVRLAHDAELVHIRSAIAGELL